MSHVDEGALHAYLDGALDALPASEAGHIRRHLASCPECALRLEEERALREEATAILAGADPGVGAAPPLEELRRRAAVRTRSGAGPRLRQMAWAASLVLAVGAGWLLRGSRDPRISQALDPLLREAARERAAPAEVVREAPAPSAAAGEEPATPDAAAVETPAGTSAPAGGAGAAVIGAEAVLERVADVVGADAARVELAAAQPVRAELADVAGAVAGAPAGAARVAPAEALSDERSRALARPHATVLAAAEEAALRDRGAGGAIAVPGLPVLSVEAARADLPAGTLRVLQLLDRDTLELLHLPAGVDPSAVGGPGDPARNQVAVRYGAGWLLARAHAATDVLDSLVLRVTGGG